MMKYVRFLVPVLVPAIILLLPAPAGLSLPAWQLFAMYIAAILGLVLRPVSEPIVLLVVISVSSICFNNLAVMLSGFSNGTAWLVFTAFMLGQAFIETGLGLRIAYILIGKIGKTTLGLGYVAALTDLVISPAIPSNTARTGGVVYPIFRSLAVTLDSTPGPSARRIGGYLTVLLYQISLTTSAIFLTAQAVNPLVATFAKSILKVDVTWLSWAQANIVPGLIILLVVPYLVYKIFPPELKHIENNEISQKGLAKIGPTTRREKILMALFILALVSWATGSITKIDPTAVAICFITSCLVTGVISWENLLNAKGAWTTFIWYAGIISLADGLAKAKFFSWCSDYLAHHISFVGYNDYVVLFGLLVLSIVARYFFASAAAYVTSFIPVLFSLGMVANVPLLALTYMMGASAAYSALLTHYGNAAAPVLFGTGYVDQKTWWMVGTAVTVLCAVVYMTIGLPYWKWLGLW
ncbi:MAG: DASS family sodium-coupled anion symporter [Negativicutes bacterium]|nr:DASS family sodium-coupled anion symporter [Negativicutes bacterium]